MGLFGMMNWLYTWYNPRVDPDAADVGAGDQRHFLAGRTGGAVGGLKRTTRRQRSATRRRKAKGAAQKPRLAMASHRGKAHGRKQTMQEPSQ